MPAFESQPKPKWWQLASLLQQAVYRQPSSVLTGLVFISININWTHSSYKWWRHRSRCNSEDSTRHIPWGNQNWKRHTYWNVHCSITIARTWKQTRCPLTDEWIKKLWYIYTMEYYSAIKRNARKWVLMRWKNREPIIQNEVSQKEKNK